MKVNFDLKKGDKVVVAVSGGVDSVCLLDLLLKQSELNLEDIVVAHFDHGIRSDSKEDAELVERIADQKGLGFELATADLSGLKAGVEEQARNHRYKFLEIIRDLYNVDWILTAHHADDQAETIMMKFLKGTFLKGLRGIKVRDFERKLYRPLLGIPKSELYEYAAKNILEFREDSTNSDMKYERNKMRNEILPNLEKTYQGLSRRLGENAEIYTGLESYLQKQLKMWLRENLEKKNFGKQIMIAKYAELESFFKFMIWQDLLQMDLSQADFRELDKMILESDSGVFRQVGDYYIYLGFQEIFISKFSEAELIEKVYEAGLKKMDIKALSSSKLIVRKFENGDIYWFEGMKEPKKLKKYFLEKQMPWYLRKGYPLIVDELSGVVNGIQIKC